MKPASPLAIELIVILILIFYFSENGDSQCLITEPTDPGCSGCTELSAAGEIIGKGQKRCATGNTVLLGDITLDGNADLVVCGTLITNGFNIYLDNTNNNLTVSSSGILLADTRLKFSFEDSLNNFGTITSSESIASTNAKSSLIMHALSTSTVDSLIVEDSASIHLLENSTVVVTSNMTVKDQATWCIEDDASADLLSLTFLASEGIGYAGEGGHEACIGVQGDNVIDSTLTLDNEIVLCKDVGATCIGCVLGGATEASSCAACGTYFLLPVELVDWNANYTPYGVELQWTTLSEQNNNYFVLQGSEDGFDFTSLVNIAGAGTSSNVRKYSYLDANNYLYYRLIQVDFDGQQHLHRIASYAVAEDQIASQAKQHTNLLGQQTHHIPSNWLKALDTKVGMINRL